MLLSRWLLPLLVALGVGGAVTLADLDMRWLDQALVVLSADRQAMTNESVVVVGIDDDSLKQFGTPVAIMHRQIGGLLEAMAAAQASAVGLDVVLPGHSYDVIQQGLDAALARGMLALRNRAPLVIGLGANADGSPRLLHPLFASLVGADGVGAAFVHHDRNGYVRRFDERIGTKGEVVPTLVGQLARRLDVPVHNGLLPLHRGALFSYVPMQTVLAWQAAGDVDSLREHFAGRIVLVGSLLAHDDQHLLAVLPTSGGHAGSVHGVFVHAVQIRALLNDALMVELPRWVALGIMLALTATWALMPGWRAWLMVIVLVALVQIGALTALKSGLVLPAASWSLALFGGLAMRTAVVAWQTATERRRLRLVFDGFVSPAVLKQILAGKLNPDLAGERREICVLFSDIRSFTSLSEHMPPEAVTDLLNRYFERMASAIHRRGGTLDKFIGDGLMAFFGAPMASANPCQDAFHTACDMLKELDDFNAEQQARGSPTVAIGIGLNFGNAFIGYVGSRDRHEYTAIGDTVNSASRLEGLTKETGFPIVLADNVLAHLSDDVQCTMLGALSVKGRAPIQAVGWKPSSREATP